MANVTMRQALSDPALLGTVLAGPSWRTWIVVLVALMGEPLYAEERVLFKEITGRDKEPGERVHEFWGIIGRRGGKSRAIAVLIVFIAILIDHSGVIVSGERPVVLCLAPTARHAPGSIASRGGRRPGGHRRGYRNGRGDGSRIGDDHRRRRDEAYGRQRVRGKLQDSAAANRGGGREGNQRGRAAPQSGRVQNRAEEVQGRL
jgi:hypothetical protein